MSKRLFLALAALLLTVSATIAQEKIHRSRFFTEEGVITMDLSTDMKRLVTVKKADDYQPATVTMAFPDSTKATAVMRLTARGQFRRENCFVPSIKLDFNDTTSPLATLKKLKLVVGCGTSGDDEKLILKEYLCYKIYNTLTPMSFRVRLLRINYTDTRKKIKSYSQYGFLIEDVDDLAKRNECREVDDKPYGQERTDREQMTLVSIFQYMIGNTDWSVPPYHNIKLMRPKTDSVSFPYAIPYDFDFCGLVNAEYATPNEQLEIKTVTERLYRGFPRTMPELQRVLDTFRVHKEEIKNLVSNFTVLDQRNRRDVTSYINEFYEIIEDRNLVQRNFIANARRE